ncbi:MAG: cobalamin-binding protein [Ilumatobacter sp.]|nr:MAG: cobalamin-binding protein [Ilumatobacter sp.]
MSASNTSPARIVSLLPSATEILFDLGLGDRIVGVTFECDFPPEARSKRIVSTSALPEGLDPAGIDAVVKERMAAGEDLYRLDRGAFADLDPDLVVTQDLCAVCAIDVTEVDDALAHLGCNAEVLTLDPMTLDEVLDTIVTAGAATGSSEAASTIVAALRDRLERLATRVGDLHRPRTLVLEWTDPAFTAGHWVPDLVTAAGGEPVLGRAGERSVGVEWDAVSTSDAEVVIVAPCGFGLDGAAALATEVMDAGRLPSGAEVWAVDADAIVVRPGPRVVEGAEVFAAILHPDHCGAPAPGSARRIG